MQKYQQIKRLDLTQVLSFVLIFVLMAAYLNVIRVSQANAGQLTSRKLTLSTSAGNTSATWAFTFTPSAATALNGIAVEVCTTASGACTVPTSWTNGGSAFSSLTYNGSSQTSWTLDNSAGFLRAKNNASATAVTGPVVLTFTTVTNPATTNETFFGRITTYTGDDFTSALDTGAVAAATSQQITVSASVDETLTFCTGTSGITSSSCSGATGSSVALGTLTSSTTGSGTSQIGVSTNAASGYAVTVNGATLTSGGNTITALAAQTTSSQGSEQFGLNLKDNATPNVGTEVAGSGDGTASANYATADQFRFVTGDTVASDAEADDFRLYTVSYMANIAGITEPGSYTSTLTYICTPTY